MINVMKKLWRKIFRISTLKYLAAFLIPAILVILINHYLDNDSWYVLSEGRAIAENGIYHTDVLSMHDGLEVTVQNYGFAVIFYWVFQTFGAAGLYVGMLILNLMVCYLIYKICMTISNKIVNLSLLLMVLTDCLLALEFVVTRAQMVSFVFFLTEILLLELYVKTNKSRFLIGLPLLSILQINLHASLWLMLILVLGVYIVDSIKKPKLHLQGYRMRPLIIVGVVMVLLGLLNPYGIKMITFIIGSYGDLRLKNLVVELDSFSPFGSIFMALVYLSIIVVLSLYIFGKNRKNIRVRYLLMFFGFLALGLNTTKGLSQFVLVLFFPMALLYKDAKLNGGIESKKGRDVLVFWSGVVCLLVFAVGCPVVVSKVRDYPSDGLKGAVDAIDENVKTRSETGGVYAGYTGYNDGGYLEYRGYKPYIDPRGEVFLKKNNGKDNILYEWDDFVNGRISVQSFLDKYSFSYILVRGEDDPFYKLEDKRYKKIFEYENEEIRVYGQIENSL